MIKFIQFKFYVRGLGFVRPAYFVYNNYYQKINNNKLKLKMHK